MFMITKLYRCIKTMTALYTLKDKCYGIKVYINKSVILNFSFLALQQRATYIFFLSSAQLSQVAQSCLTLYDPMDCSMPGFPVHHQLPELAQFHVHRVGDAMQLSHPMSSPFPASFDLSQHQGLF